MTSYQNVFGGNVVYPAEVSYRAFTLSADTTLAWPTELATNTNVVSQIMDVTPSGGGLSIIMPPANEVSVGETTLIFNVGASTFTVKDSAGNVIASIASGLAWQIYLTNNATAAGTWRAVQYAAGVSSANAASLAGFGIKALANTLNQSTPVSTVNADYTLNSPDRAHVFAWTGGAGTFTLTSAATLGNDWFCYVRNNGTGALTLAAASGEDINGGASVVYNPGDSSLVICDGVSFFTVGYGQSPTFVFDYIAISLTGQSTPYTLSGAELNRITYNFSGVLTANTEIIVPDTIQQYWIANTTSGAYTLTIKTASGTGVEVAQGARAILYCDAVDVYNASTSSISLPITVAQGGTGSTTASGARVNLGGTSIGISLFTAASSNDVWSALGTIPATAGGTGLTGYAIGDIIYASGATTLNKLADVATGNVLLSGGVGVAPSYGKVGLTTHITGTLPIGNGGTGVTATPTNGQLLIGNGSGYTVANLTAGSGISISNSAGGISIATTTSMVYPGSGIAVSTGSAWGTSLTAPSGTIVGTTDTQNLSNKTLQASNSIDDTGTIAATSPGFRGVPQNSQTASYTLALTDAGKHISITTGGVVIPANGSVAFPIGTTIVVYNNSSSSQNITITTDTLRFAGTATTGTRALAQRGLATLVKVAATEWVASGAGLS